MTEENLAFHTSAHTRDVDGRDRVIEGYIAEGMKWLTSVLEQEKFPFDQAYIYDIGCDYGYALQWMKENNHIDDKRLIGVDAYYENNPFDLQINRMDMNTDSLFYMVYSKRGFPALFIINHALEHVKNPYQVIDNLYINNPSHYIFIAVPEANHPWALWDGHYSIWTKDFLKRFMEINYFTEIANKTVEFRPEKVEIWGVYKRNSMNT